MLKLARSSTYPHDKGIRWLYSPPDGDCTMNANVVELPVLQENFAGPSNAPKRSRRSTSRSHAVKACWRLRQGPAACCWRLRMCGLSYPMFYG